jgi:hypothetical protein
LVLYQWLEESPLLPGSAATTAVKESLESRPPIPPKGNGAAAVLNRGVINGTENRPLILL